jgi:UDP-N-acetylglucosamine 2-epimerase
MDFNLSNVDINRFGHGVTIDFTKPYMLVCLHAVTTRFDETIHTLKETIKALAGYQTIWILPNIDAGGISMTKILNQQMDESLCRFIKHIPQDMFYTLMANCACMIGNSSAGIREGSFLGTPVIDIGSRQADRETASNVLHAPEHSHSISEWIRQCIERHAAHDGKYPQSFLYGDGHAARKISDALCHHVSTLRIQKN